MRFLQRISLRVSFTHLRSRLCPISIELLSSAEPACIYFHTSSSDEILTKNQLEGQFHTPAVSIKLLSSEEPTSCPIFHTLSSGEIPTKSQLEGQSFHTLSSGKIPTKSQLEGHSLYTLSSG